jgi:hypothetical protein
METKEIKETKEMKKMKGTKENKYHFRPETRLQLQKQFAPSLIISDVVIDETLCYISELTTADVDVLGTSAENKAENKASPASKFRHFVYEQEHKNINAFRNVPHCFWSGIQARARANVLAREGKAVTDSSYPFISFLFAVCSTIRSEAGGVYGGHETLISFAISRIYASFAQDLALVFLSSDKPSEPTGITLGNNFWMAELPVLQANKHNGKITDIKVSINTNSIWETYSFNELLFLPLWRRSWHMLDDIKHKPSFVTQKMETADWEAWRTAPPRKPITVYTLFHICRKWKTLKITQSDGRKIRCM